MHVHARYLRKLERDGKINRKLEFLPDDKAIAERRQARLGLVAPEFSVVLAYSKLLSAEPPVAAALGLPSRLPFH